MGKRKICTWCGDQGKTQSAHMISKQLGKILAIVQLGKPLYDYEHQLIETMVRTMRRKDHGEIRLCEECHNKSDRMQEKMVEKLKEIITEGK